MSKPKFHVPQPDRVRRIQGSFAWIDHHLLRCGLLQAMSHQDQSLYLFLALAADRNGVSFYRMEKICGLLGLDPGELHVARSRLVDLQLLVFEPYSAVNPNGFYQLLPVPQQAPALAEQVMQSLGAPLQTPRPAAETPSHRAVARTSVAQTPGGAAATSLAGIFKSF